MIEHATRTDVFSQSRDANFQKLSNPSHAQPVALRVKLYRVLVFGPTRINQD